MSSNLYYLLTMLPTLPALGGHVNYEDTLSKLKSESADISYISDLLEAETEINRCGKEFFVNGGKSFSPQFAESIPESFKIIFDSYSTVSEAKWLTAVYKAWFELIIETGHKTGSKLLQEWAKWEFSLRMHLIAEETPKGEKISSDYAELFEILDKLGSYPDAEAAAAAYGSFSTPFEAEKFLDQTRIDYLRRAASQFSFTTDELVAYMLEMRIHNRYSRLQPEQGRRILEEVTKL